MCFISLTFMLFFNIYFASTSNCLLDNVVYGLYFAVERISARRWYTLSSWHPQSFLGALFCVVLRRYLIKYVYFSLPYRLHIF
jgi:hypothetical protein